MKLLGRQTVLKPPVFVQEFHLTEKRNRFSFVGVQTPGVLDDLFWYNGPLGVWVDARGVKVALWAPTAHQVITR